MHPKVFQAFDEVVSSRAVKGGAVLEVGATPSADTLLCLPALRDARKRVGINIAAPTEFRNFRILSCNANKMICFDSETFDLVLCNAVLEHDPFFWQSLDEVRRVLKKAGLFVVGVPGYVRLRTERYKGPLRRVLGRLPARQRLTQLLDPLLSPTVTFEVHNHPGDYYRFSEMSVREVLLSQYTDIEVRSLMMPPRIIGAGRKPS